MQHRVQPKNYEMNMTEGKILGKLIKYAIPLICTNLLQVLFNATDVAVLGMLVDEKAVGAVDVWLVDRDVFAHEIAEGFDCEANVIHKYLGRVGGCEAAHILEPQRIREVVDGEHRAYATRDHVLDLITVVCDNVEVKRALRGLYARPLDAEAVDLDAHISHHIYVLFEAAIVVTSSHGCGLVVYFALVGEARPVIVTVAALDLCRGGSRTEEESFL